VCADLRRDEGAHAGLCRGNLADDLCSAVHHGNDVFEVMARRDIVIASSMKRLECGRDEVYTDNPDLAISD
jgi:hypothetical protein